MLAGRFDSGTFFRFWNLFCCVLNAKAEFDILHHDAVCYINVDFSILDSCFDSVTCFTVWWIRKQCSTSASLCSSCFCMETCFSVYWMQNHPGLTNERQNGDTRCSTLASWCSVLPQCWSVVSNLAGCFDSVWLVLFSSCVSHAKVVFHFRIMV